MYNTGAINKLRNGICIIFTNIFHSIKHLLPNVFLEMVYIRIYLHYYTSYHILSAGTYQINIQRVQENRFLSWRRHHVLQNKNSIIINYFFLFQISHGNLSTVILSWQHVNKYYLNTIRLYEKS